MVDKPKLVPDTEPGRMSVVQKFMVAQGYTQIRVGFSGGHDSGGVDEISATTILGEHDVLDENSTRELKVWNQGNGQWEPREDITPEQLEYAKAIDALVAPVYARWHFNNYPYVTGSIEWSLDGAGYMRYTETDEVSTDREEFLNPEWEDD